MDTLEGYYLPSKMSLCLASVFALRPFQNNELSSNTFGICLCVPRFVTS